MYKNLGGKQGVLWEMWKWSMAMFICNVNVCLRLLTVLKEERVGWGIGRGREK